MDIEQLEKVLKGISGITDRLDRLIVIMEGNQPKVRKPKATPKRKPKNDS